MLDLRHEPMGPVFDKWHVVGMPFPAVFHRFNQADMGDPHDHPWAFRSVILDGGYIEDRYDLHTGKVWRLRRKVGDSFLVPATRIHRIVELPRGECWTLILPRPDRVRTSCFWQFRDDGIYFRKWHDADWTRYGDLP